MRTWPRLLASGLALTIGLIACFAPDDGRVVTDAAARLPVQTPLFAVVRAPETLLREVSRVGDTRALDPESWARNGLDPTAPITLARLPGSASIWAVSAAIADEAVAATGVDDLLRQLADVHHALLHDGRVHALVGLSSPDPDTWRRAVEDFVDTGRETSLASAESLEPLGTDDVMVYGDPAGLLGLLDAPLWALGLSAHTDPCTLRGNAQDTTWTVALSCPLEERSAWTTMLAPLEDDLTVSLADTHGVAHLMVEPVAVARLWEVLAEDDPELDRAHSALLDATEAADVSLSALWRQAFTGELTVAMTHRPRDRRPLGLVGSLGIGDEDLLDALASAWVSLLSETPGVRVEAEEVGEHQGWTIEWLRHRGHDLGLALDGQSLLVSYGRADLEDALAVSTGEPWEPAGRAAGMQLALGDLLGLEGLLGALRVDLDVHENALGLTLDLDRRPDISSRRLLAGLLDEAQDRLDAHTRQALHAQISGVCDAIDLHAVDHGLPVSLDALQLGSAAVDPWGHPLHYVHPAVRRPHHRYDLCSAGADGRLGSRDDVCYE